MQIQEKPKYATVFEWMGGEKNVKSLVERFYDLMDLEPRYKILRGVHGTDLRTLCKSRVTPDIAKT